MIRFAEDNEGEREIEDDFSTFMCIQLLIQGSENLRFVVMTLNTFK